MCTLGSLSWLFSGLASVEELEQQTRLEWEKTLELLEDEQQAGDLAREIGKTAMEEVTRITALYEAQLLQLRSEREALQVR